MLYWNCFFLVDFGTPRLMQWCKKLSAFHVIMCGYNPGAEKDYVSSLSSALLSIVSIRSSFHDCVVLSRDLSEKESAGNALCLNRTLKISLKGLRGVRSSRDCFENRVLAAPDRGDRGPCGPGRKAANRNMQRGAVPLGRRLGAAVCSSSCDLCASHNC